MSENQDPNMEWEDANFTGESAQDIMEQFLATADVHAVYHEPIVHGETLIIPAAEVLSITGFGSGGGRSSAGEGGGGGGGGGHIFTRPVAVIIASGDNVRVEPVFDLTKIILASLTAFGFMLTTLSRMKRGDQ